MVTGKSWKAVIGALAAVMKLKNFILQYPSRQVFVGFVKDNATLSSILYFENHCIVFCAKPKEVDPIKLIFL